MHEKSNVRKWVVARLAAAPSSRNADRIGIPRLTVEMGFGLRLAQRTNRMGATHASHGWPWMATQGLRVAGIAQRNAPRPRRFARSASTRFGGSSSGRTTVSDTVYLGSNPSPPAKQGPHLRALFLTVCASERVS